MKVIGLTGGIGSGKSTVSQFLAELGAVIIDADKVGHEAFKPNTELWREVINTFGKQILAPEGEIDRKKLGAIVFSNPEKRERLNQIMHPRMCDIMKARIEEYRQQEVEVLVLEAALLVEANWIPLVDEVWVTQASEAAVLKRLRQRSGLSQTEAKARIRSQLSSEERLRYADIAINNDGDIDEVKATVNKLWQRLHT